MLFVMVNVQVKTEVIETFKVASIENASQSVKEEGVFRFEVIQDVDDLSRFMLVEIYRTADAPAAHKETAHYKKWKATVESMMAEPRSSRKFVNLFPPDARL